MENKRKVLIVEDEVLVREGLKSVIGWNKLGMEVVGDAANGRQALEIYERERPDIVLTDIRMPVMDGLELIARIREEDKKTGIVILTCYEKFGYLQEALRMGVSDYILKLKMKPAEIEAAMAKVKKKLDEDEENGAGPDGVEEFRLQKEEELKRYIFYHQVSIGFFRSRMERLSLAVKEKDMVLLRVVIQRYEKARLKIMDDRGMLIRFVILNTTEEIMEKYPEAILYGQDVGARLGGVFREAATLGEKFGAHRVFNTAIQEAYIAGSTAGLSALGLKPIVEVQFADYIYPALNQLVTELSKSCYLTNGKFPVQMVLRVPIGAYGGGGPYHSGSIESTLLSIKGIKVAYPSNAADMKGLMKAAFLDPNPVVMLEHKGLYWSKVPGTEEARTIEPDEDYILPLGQASLVLQANADKIQKGETVCIITYGMGVYWAKAAAEKYPGQVEVMDLRTLYPLDEKAVYELVQKHGKVLVLTEEQQSHSFAESLALRIYNHCYHFLDTRIEVLGALD